MTSSVSIFARARIILQGIKIYIKKIEKYTRIIISYSEFIVIYYSNKYVNTLMKNLCAVYQNGGNRISSRSSYTYLSIGMYHVSYEKSQLP